MPPKDDDNSSTKEVVTKKQKQMLNREELDLSLIAEAFGGVVITESTDLVEFFKKAGKFLRRLANLDAKSGMRNVPFESDPNVRRIKGQEILDTLLGPPPKTPETKQLDLPGMTPEPPKSSPNILKGLKTVGKTPVGKFASRVAPGAGLAIGTVDAANRIRKGDYGGAALSGLGAAASTVLPPGPGTLAALGIAGVQAATDTVGLTGDRSIKPPKPARPVILPGEEPGQKPKKEPQTQPQPEPGGKRKPSAPTIVQPGSKPQIQTPGQNVNAKPNVLPMPIPVSTPTKRGTDTKTPRPRGRRPFGFLGFPDQPGGVIGRRQNPQ